jgi:uncharacterized protein
MKHDDEARHLNLEAFARAQGNLTGSKELSHFKRLQLEAQGVAATSLVRFTAEGQIRSTSGQGEQIWLMLTAEVALPQTCQRCLGPVDVPVVVERDFRFVATEEQAELEDEESEEDVLVLSRDFNLLELVEDELLMALPVVPKHDVCPTPVKLQVADPDFVENVEQKPNPFAVLQQLKTKP